MKENKNKKIKNATPLEYKGIKFKSRLEVTIFKCLDEQGCSPLYEPYKYTIWRGFKPTVPFYIKDKKTKQIKLDATKQIDITYTPDIVFDWGKYRIIIEVKPQFMNDVFPYKRKMFRQFLEIADIMAKHKPIYAQLGSKKEVMEFLQVLKDNYEKD